MTDGYGCPLGFRKNTNLNQRKKFNYEKASNGQYYRGRIDRANSAGGICASNCDASLYCGTFNDWRPAVTPMVPLGNGHWSKALTLPPGVYEYRLVVDGAWMPDPRAIETVPNPFGGVNSVLKTEELRELTLWAAALKKTSRMHLCL